jgi:hypothetical protein
MTIKVSAQEMSDTSDSDDDKMCERCDGWGFVGTNPSQACTCELGQRLQHDPLMFDLLTDFLDELKAEVHGVLGMFAENISYYSIPIEMAELEWHVEIKWEESDWKLRFVPKTDEGRDLLNCCGHTDH